jgi:hypothetical protein
MFVAVVLVVAQMQSAGGPATPVRAGAADSALSRAHAAADSFVRAWGSFWQSTQLIQQRMQVEILPPGISRGLLGEHGVDSIAASWEAAVPRADLRHHIIHCHPDGVSWRRLLIPGMRGGTWKRLDEYMIESRVGKRAICPSWLQSGVSVPWDEASSIDAGIIAPFKPALSSARAALLTVLDSVAAVRSRDDWLAGQRVRFAVDQRDLARAERVATECQAEPWWCGMLRGYVAHAQGAIVIADSLFVSSIAAMPAVEQCRWTDLGVLLPEEDAVAYARIPCARRAPLNERLWWLSDPLYLERWNERRAEHYARVTLARLRSGTTFSEHWDMRNEGGGNAVREMIVRYGWPSLVVWGGIQEDASHLSYLGGGSAMHERFATAEYGLPRFHPVPAWAAIVNPFDAQATDWTLTERAAREIARPRMVWWPEEHFARRAGPMVQLWDQSAMLRRDSTVLLFVATDIPQSELRAATSDTLRGAMVFATDPASMRSEPATAAIGHLSIFKHSIPSVPQVVSLELEGSTADGRQIAARARFGIDPPRPLIAMQPGEAAISAPMLVAPPDGENLPITDPVVAPSRMLGTTILRAARRVGVYWETYGIDIGDTVDVSLRVERRESPPGLARRMGFWLGLAERTDGGISMRWRDPSPERGVTTIRGRIPIQGRSVSIDISRLAPGDYAMVVSVARPGMLPISAGRDFRIAPREGGGVTESR